MHLYADHAFMAPLAQPAPVYARFVLEAHSETAPTVPHATFVLRAFTLHPELLIARSAPQEHSAALHQAVRLVLLAPRTLNHAQRPSLAHHVPLVDFLRRDPLHVQHVSLATCWTPPARASPALPGNFLTPMEYHAWLADRVCFLLLVLHLAQTVRWVVTAFNRLHHALYAQ